MRETESYIYNGNVSARLPVRKPDDAVPVVEIFAHS